MPFRTPFHIPFRKLFPPFTLTALKEGDFGAKYKYSSTSIPSNQRVQKRPLETQTSEKYRVVFNQKPRTNPWEKSRFLDEIQIFF